LSSAAFFRLGLPWVRAVALHRYYLFCIDVSDNLSSYLPKRSCWISNQLIIERSWHDALPKGLDHQGLVLGLELYCKSLKPIQKILYRFSLSLLYTKKIEREWRSGLVNDELFPKQLEKLVEGGDVAIGKANKTLQRRSCERSQEYLAMYGVCSSRYDHLGIERCQTTLEVFFTCESNLWRYVISWYDSFHDRWKKWS